MTGMAPKQITLLLFSLEGVRFGVEAGQVLATAAYDGELGEDLFWLHERIGFGAPAVYRVPTVITVGVRGGAQRRVIIDGIEEIADFAIEELRPLPAAVEPFCLRRGMWGVIPRQSGVILLLDFLIPFGDRTIPPTPSSASAPSAPAGISAEFMEFMEQFRVEAPPR